MGHQQATADFLIQGTDIDLRDVLNYDPETGDFTWTSSKGFRVKGAKQEQPVRVAT